jgi:peptidoglycan/xylan/chitin deacetylase (PgdA/CDA1 family)
VAELVGRPAETFAYPYGDYDDRVVDAVRRAGFRGACTIALPARRMQRDPFRVNRIDVCRFSGNKGVLGKLFFLSCLSGVFADYFNIKKGLPFVRTRTFEYKERRRRDASRR